MLRISPTTRPRTLTSRTRIGSIVSFSGCRRMWSPSRKKRLTVASSSTSATMISPSRAVSCALARRPDHRRGSRRSSSTRRGPAAGIRRCPPRHAAASRCTPRCSPRRGSACPAATWPSSGRPGLDTASRTPARGAVEQLHRPRLGRVAPQQSELLQVGQMRMHRRRRREPHGLADVAHRRRIAVAPPNTA